jgi:hypothetical protein
MQYYNKIAKEQFEIPKYKFAVMGAFDSIAGIMGTLAVNYISSASLIVLVQQSAIPISMIISRYSLGATYSMPQYYGAGIVMGGIVVVLLPTLLGSSASTSDSTLLWIFVLVLSCIPMCLSSVYKEKALGEVDINVVYLNGWVAIFQTLFAIPLCFPSAYIINMPFDQILPNMYHGMFCLMGINTVTAENIGPNQVIDNCEMAPYYVGTYFFFNIIFNILIILILKHGSANILFMSSTVIVPLSNIVFSLKITPGHQPMKVTDVYGLLIIMGGLIVYRFYDSIIDFYNVFISSKKLTKEEEIIKKKAKLIEKEITSKQTKMIGINQVETLNTIMSTRIITAQKHNLFRTPQQARGAFLHRLGIPPSPKVQKSPSGGYQMSPSFNNKPSHKNKNVSYDSQSDSKEDKISKGIKSKNKLPPRPAQDV